MNLSIDKIELLMEGLEEIYSTEWEEQSGKLKAQKARELWRELYAERLRLVHDARQQERISQFMRG